MCPENIYCRCKALYITSMLLIYNTVVLSIQVNEKSFDLKEGWYKMEGDKTGMNGCMLPW